MFGLLARQTRLRLLSYLCIALSAPPGWTQDAPIDLVAINANVITVDSERPAAEAFAVRGDRIVAVGASQQIRQMISAETRVMDLGSRTVVPGFNDAHMHPQPIYPPLSRLGDVPCDPDHVRSLDELIEALREKANVTPRGSWVIGTRYQDTKLGRHPTRWDLDKASTAADELQHIHVDRTVVGGRVVFERKPR
jgi:hypothetical protein